MSTSDFGASGELARFMDMSGASGAMPGGIGALGGGANAPSGMLDPAMLTRLANEMFRAMDMGGRQGVANMPSTPGDTALDPTRGLPIPASQSFAVPAPQPGAMTTGQGSGAAMGVPASITADDLSVAPAFAFLQDVRALDAMARAAGGPALPVAGAGIGGAAGSPSESQLRMPAAMAPATPGVQAIPASGSAASLAGAPTEVQTRQAAEEAVRGSSAIAPSGTVTPTMEAMTSPAMLGDSVSPTEQGVKGGESAHASPKGGGLFGAELPPEFRFLTDVRALDEFARSADSEVRSAVGAAVTPAVPGVQAAPALGGGGVSSVAGVGGGMPNVPGFPNLGNIADPVSATRLASLPGLGSLASGIAAPSSPAFPFGTSAADVGSPQFGGVPVPSADQMMPGRSMPGFLSLTRPLEPLMAGDGQLGFDAPPNDVGSLARVGDPGSMGGLRAADFSSIPFDVQAVRRDFPILSERVNGRPLVWLDNAATTQKPRAVIERLTHFYEHENSNVHRAAHTLAARSTDAYEAAREKVRRFLNARDSREIIFVRGTTEAINLVAQSWGKRNIQEGDEIVITHLEHHANIVPWQMLCSQSGAKLRVAPVDDSGQIILEEYEKLFNPRTRLAAFSHVSNALGTITPVKAMVEIAHRHGAKALVDGAQSVAHTRVDMQEYDCDFFVFSGHKIFAPTGIGVVFGKSEILENTPPWQGGGNMIADVTFEKTLYNPPPVRFEAGTGNIADAVGLGAALDYIDRVGMPNISRYEHDLLVYGTQVLQGIPGVRLIGTAREKASVLSFVLDGFRTEDVGAALARDGIAVRSGHHCAQPILRRFGVESTVRPSLAFYNTCEELDALGAAIWNIKRGYAPSVI